MTGRDLSTESLGGRLGRLAAIAAGFWLLLAPVAYWLEGTPGLEGLSLAALLCLVPGLLVMSLAAFWPSDGGSNANATLAVVLGGMALRMLFVLVGMLVVKSVRPDLGFRGFIVWLLAFYLAMLLAETLLVLKGNQEKSAQPTSVSPESQLQNR